MVMPSYDSPRTGSPSTDTVVVAASAVAFGLLGFAEQLLLERPFYLFPEWTRVCARVWLCLWLWRGRLLRRVLTLILCD